MEPEFSIHPEARELADLLRPMWAEKLAVLRASGVPLNAEDDEIVDGSLLEKLQAKRAALAEKVEPLIAKREEARGLRGAMSPRRTTRSRPPRSAPRSSAAEKEFREEVKPLLKEIKSLDLRIEQQELIERSKELAAKASGPSVVVTREEETYRDGDKDSPSYFVDLAAHLNPNIRSKHGTRADGFAERLEKHNRQMQDVLPRSARRRDRRAERQIEAAENSRPASVSRRMRSRGFETSPFEKRAPSRLDGQGEFFVPPLWLIDQYIPFLRAGRVAAGLARQMELPSGTDSINVPKLTTPTRTGIQTADNAPIVSQDIKDGFINASVKTIAGFEDVPIQLIEQSPGAIIDRVIMTDMLADYDEKLDLQVIAGNGSGAPLSGGQIVGMYPSTNWGATALTWTAASPTAQGYFQVLGAMASKTAQSRFNLQDFTFLMHPRRWFWAATQPDTTGRPLIENQDFGPYNAMALEVGGSDPIRGFRRQSAVRPGVYIDANVPTTTTRVTKRRVSRTPMCGVRSHLGRPLAVRG